MPLILSLLLLFSSKAQTAGLAVTAAGSVQCIYHLRLYKKKELTTMFACELGGLQGGCRRTARVCDHAVESHPFGCELRKRRAKGARRPGRALPDLLAAYFLVCLPTRLFD